jgi:hypothetical protein
MEQQEQQKQLERPRQIPGYKGRGTLMPIYAGMPGNRTGKPNKTTRLLREALILAAEKHGSNGNGKDGLVGFLLHLIDKDLGAFATLLGRVLPLQVSVKDGDEDRMASRRQLLTELKSRGIVIERGVFIGDNDRVLDAEIIEPPPVVKDDGTPVPGA